ncbi:hypothetical protein [Staphylococcus phage PT1-1]
MEVQKTRKKPVEVEFVQFTGKNKEEIYKWSNGACHNMLDMDSKDLFNFKFVVETLEGVMKVDINDYIIKGVKGEFYPVKPEIFHETYEETS